MEHKTMELKLLDTTLRDGSYVNNFGFSANDTFNITRDLDEAGVDLIEVGHGVGLNASNSGHGFAAEDDKTYMKSAAQAIKNAKWGMFAIPGICELSHLDSCFDHNIGFLRFGVSIDNYDTVVPYIEKTKKNGVIACVNFMKSYTKEPYLFERAARKIASVGADYIYIVDSAGNMTPPTVRKYCERVQDLNIGFHAHNNLGLANANALMAESCGAQIIDCSLQGMGRSSGNSVTEHFVAIMHREGKLKKIDLMKLLDLGQKQIRPRLNLNGHEALDLVAGYAGFHSSYMNRILDTAQEFEVDPRILIIEVCKITQSDAPEKVVEKVAKILSSKSQSYKFKGVLNNIYSGNEQDKI